MSCHRVRRELLWMSRFGELGPDSDEHLEHLAGCRTCRDEVGFDREMVRQLRRALAARVEGMEPSSGVWEQVRVQAQLSERRGFPWPWRRPLDTLAMRRTLTAMAGTGLAVVLALNTEVVPVALPPADTATPGASATVDAPEARISWGRQPRAAAATVPVAEAQGGAVALVLSRPDPEGLVGNVDAAAVAAAPEPVPDPGADPGPATQLRVTVRPPLSPEPLPAAERAAATSTDEADEPAGASPPPAGAPT